MEIFKKIRRWVFRISPGNDKHIEEERTWTSKLLYARSRMGFTRIWAPGTHIEAEDYIFNRRHNASICKYFPYFGPKGELAIYLLAALLINHIIKTNLKREENIEELLNDRNVFFTLNLPVEDRII